MRFKALVAGALVALATFAQTTVSVTGPATARPGATVSLTVSSTAATPNVTALQWTLKGHRILRHAQGNLPTESAKVSTLRLFPRWDHQVYLEQRRIEWLEQRLARHQREGDD